MDAQKRFKSFGLHRYTLVTRQAGELCGSIQTDRLQLVASGEAGSGLDPEVHYSVQPGGAGLERLERFPSGRRNASESLRPKSMGSDIALHEPGAGRRLVAAGHRNGRAAQRLVVIKQPDALDFNLALDQFLEAIDETLDVRGFHVLVQCRLG